MRVLNESWPNRFFSVKRGHIEIYFDCILLDFFCWIGLFRMLIIRMHYFTWIVFHIFKIINVKRLNIFVEVEARVCFVLLKCWRFLLAKCLFILSWASFLFFLLKLLLHFIVAVVKRSDIIINILESIIEFAKWVLYVFWVFPLDQIIDVFVHYLH